MPAFLTWIIIGLVAGLAAAIYLDLNKQMGWIPILITGILGALLGGKIVERFGPAREMQFDLYSLASSFGGALILLFLAREFLFNRRK